jgi:hypothetical protein
MCKEVGVRQGIVFRDNCFIKIKVTARQPDTVEAIIPIWRFVLYSDKPASLRAMAMAPAQSEKTGQAALYEIWG